MQAITVGLENIIFLEHMEAGIRYFETTWLTEDDFDIYFTEGERLQDKYRGKIKISLGVEVGYNPTHKEELLIRLNKRQWDAIGISYHFMDFPKRKHHINLVSRKEKNLLAIETIGCDKVLSNYFKTLTEAIQELPGTVLCHLDAALRFQPGIKINDRYLKQIRNLLQAVKEKKMSLEINTSGFPIRGTPFPAPFIIKEAVALGIPLLPGSDAHKPADVGRKFDQLHNYLQELND